jgi:phosphate transport system substrate-binding protein
MKLFTITFISYSIFSQIIFAPSISAQKKNSGQISISGAFALYPVVVKWAEEYKRVNPGIRIDISAGGAGKGISDVLSGMVDIGMVSREVYPEEMKKGAYIIPVARDAVVAIINEKNPLLDEVLAKGLRREQGNNIWITGTTRTWAQAFGLKSTIPIHTFTRSDACGAAEVWAKYFGKKQEDLAGTGVFGDPGLAQAVRKDPLGIGFNNMGYAYDAQTRKQLKGLRVVPLDLNANGTIDTDENFYNTMDDLISAISAGKYPSPPARDLYFVLKGKPGEKVLADFIKWALSDGQKFVREAGFISLPEEEIKAELKKLQ